MSKPTNHRHNLQQKNTTNRICRWYRYRTSQSAVRDANLALERKAVKVGLKINEQKAKYMIAARNDRTIRDVGEKRGNW
jgi:hypothetical protein